MSSTPPALREQLVDDAEFAGAADERGTLAVGDPGGGVVASPHRARETAPDTELRPNRY